MTRSRQDRVLAILSRDGDWVTAATLADAIGVTPRSIRTYVTALNARVPDGVVVESGAPSDVLDDPHHERTRAFLSKVL